MERKLLSYLRAPYIWKNKDPVKKDVDEETANRCVERDLYIMNRPQNQGQGHCDGHHYKRSCAVPEINCTLFDHSSVGCIDPEKLIVCERDSHKGIIIGKGGAMLKKIGSNARYR